MRRSRLPIILAGVLLLGALVPALAAERFSAASVRKLDKIIADRMKTDRLPSVVVGIWVPGEGHYVRLMGVANVRTGRLREPTELFRIASISKTVIATAVLQLVDEKRIGKDDKIAKWYPNFPRADEITIDDLLRMRSGMPDPVGESFVKDYFNDRLTTLTPRDMIERAARQPKAFQKPDQKTVYNNLNFVMLGDILEKVTGRRIDRLLRSKIFRPLDMKNSVYPQVPYLYGRLHGYSSDLASGKLIDVTLLNPAPAGGAGAVVSNLTDLHKFARALCTGTLLRPETQRARLEGQRIDKEPAFVKYGEGLVQLGPFCGHNGTIFGFSSEMWYLPALKAIIVINVNRLDEDDQSKSSELFLLLTKALFQEYVPW